MNDTTPIESSTDAETQSPESIISIDDTNWSTNRYSDSEKSLVKKPISFAVAADGLIWDLQKNQQTAQWINKHKQEQYFGIDYDGSKNKRLLRKIFKEAKGTVRLTPNMVYTTVPLMDKYGLYCDDTVDTALLPKKDKFKFSFKPLRKRKH